jgi:4a-hydroxytetrahydrobiopterin dehydratase
MFFMEVTNPPPDRSLTLSEISAAITDPGWRLILGAAVGYVRVGSLTQAAEVAAAVIAAAGADESLRADLRPDRVVLTLESPRSGRVTSREAELAQQVAAAVRELGLAITADPGEEGGRSAQVLEITIDALNIPAIRPFWKAVLGYGDEPGWSGPDAGLNDPLGQQPAIWFQQMDAQRPQRNRIHFDISVPHDTAERRIEAALEAGGRLLSDAEAPSFWVLADPEGNEACITTWQGRDD